VDEARQPPLRRAVHRALRLALEHGPPVAEQTLQANKLRRVSFRLGVRHPIATATAAVSPPRRRRIARTCFPQCPSGLGASTRHVPQTDDSQVRQSEPISAGQNPAAYTPRRRRCPPSLTRPVSTPAGGRNPAKPTFRSSARRRSCPADCPQPIGAPGAGREEDDYARLAATGEAPTPASGGFLAGRPEALGFGARDAGISTTSRIPVRHTTVSADTLAAAATRWPAEEVPQAPPF